MVGFEAIVSSASILAVGLVITKSFVLKPEPIMRA